MEFCNRRNIDINHLVDGITATGEIGHNQGNRIGPRVQICMYRILYSGCIVDS